MTELRTGRTSRTCPGCGRTAEFDYGTAAVFGSPFDADEFDAVEYYVCESCGEESELLVREGGSTEWCNGGDGR